MRFPTPLRRLGALPLYPLLAAAFPVVWLYAQNVQEAIDPSEVLLPMGVSVGATLALMLAIGALSHRWAAAALTSTLLFYFFTRPY